MTPGGHVNESNPFQQQVLPYLCIPVIEVNLTKGCQIANSIRVFPKHQDKKENVFIQTGFRFFYL